MAETKALGFADDPQSARLRFRLRGLNNLLLVIVIFIVAAFLAAPAPYATTVDIVVGAALIYGFFFVLEKRAISFHCPHRGCEKHIDTNTGWVCGFKGCTNLNVVVYSFVNCCETCRLEPKAYECHHCGKIIFLSSDKLATNAARCLNAPAEPGTEEKTKKEWQIEKETREQAIALAELDEKLSKIKERVDGPKMKKPGEKLVEKFEQIYVESMGPREYARKKRAEVSELYKDDPVSLKDANDAIDDILRRLC